ncbi:hypothetical protein ABZ614_40390 [Streptomyces sp. NPDC013178]|uniref:hypothetical protein n=1 Tax=Streptomyces sp. NPDC013178 TaxID=3155118 RepID=UPI0033F942FB
MGRRRRREQSQEQRQAYAETLRLREQVASAVRLQPACAGLPVLPAGMQAGQGSGAVVYVDAQEQLTGTGVWVGWGLAPAVATFIGQAGADTEEGASAGRYGYAVIEAMTGAIRDILTAGGYSVDVNLGTEPHYTVYVVAAP